MTARAVWAALLLVGGAASACSSSDPPVAPAPPTGDEPAEETKDAGPTTTRPDASASGLRADRFATKVVSFTPGACAGFGANRMPEIVLGPPSGAPAGQGGTDVVSLGTGGEIVLSLEPNAIVDGPGVDLLVFENAFLRSGTDETFAEPGEVSVSDDGETWTTFPCTATAAPWGACAGWHVVTPSGAGVSPVDPAQAGGDPYDLADIGVARARFVRIRDTGGQRCASSSVNTNGFDLDAIAAVNAEEM